MWGRQRAISCGVRWLCLYVIRRNGDSVNGESDEDNATHNGDSAHRDFGSHETTTNHSQASADAVANNTASDYAINVLQWEME